MRGSPETARERAVAAPRAPRFHNRTRTSPSIARRLLRERKLHLLPLYAVLRTSDLAREGIEGSGSYRFADHVYRGRASGRFGVGALVDRMLLGMRSARSMRSRFVHARDEILAAARRQPPGTPFRALSVPCGIARELIEAASTLRAEAPGLYERATFYGLDLDPRPLELTRALATDLHELQLIQGDALDPASYPSGLDVVVSTGLGEFLDEPALLAFFGHCRAALREGGAFVTSGSRRDPLSDLLLRELAELRAHYREPEEMIRLLRRAGFDDVSAKRDAVGLQTLLVARTTSARRAWPPARPHREPAHSTTGGTP